VVAEPVRAPRAAASSGGLGSVVPLVMALFGVIGGARAIGDNSTFVHLRTGVEIFRSGVPTTDSYSFTAFGDPFVVQSWLISTLYGAGYELSGDFRWAVVLHGVLMGSAAYLLARLVRTDRVATSGGLAFLTVISGAMWWSARPLLAGIVAFAATVTIVVAKRHPGWLVLVGVVWVASHGSWPIGLAWLGLVLVGRLIDTRSVDRRSVAQLGALTGGVLLGAISPVGPRILTFPFVAIERRDIFASVVEWGSPSFSGGPALLSLVAFALGTGLVLRRRAPWAYTLPYGVILVAGLVSLRNLPMAAVALAAALSPIAESLRGFDASTTVAQEEGNTQPTSIPMRLVVGGLSVACVAWLGLALGGGDVSVDTYPYRELRALEAAGIVDGDTRIASPETVGCLQVLRRVIEPPERAELVPPVFVDDRFDMYPRAVLEDQRSLISGSDDPLEILDRREIDVVVWSADSPLTQTLLSAPEWRKVELDLDADLPGADEGDYSVFVRSTDG